MALPFADEVFEEALRTAPELEVVSDEPLVAGVWFRGIVSRRRQELTRRQ